MNLRTTTRTRLRARHVHDAPLPHTVLRAYVACLEKKLEHSDRPMYAVAAIGTALALLALSIDRAVLSSETPLVVATLLAGYGLLRLRLLLATDERGRWSRQFVFDVGGLAAWAVAMEQATAFSLLLCYAMGAAALLTSQVLRGSPDVIVARVRWLATGAAVVGVAATALRAATSTEPPGLALIAWTACTIIGIWCVGRVATAIVLARRRNIQRKTIASLERLQTHFAGKQGRVLSG